MIKVAVTELEYRKAKGVFASAAGEGIECICARPGEADLAGAIRDHQAGHAIVGVDTYSQALYDALPRGGVIARFGVGHDGIDKSLATARGLFCTNTPGALNDSVAESQ